jgi:hypothetical protein
VPDDVKQLLATEAALDKQGQIDCTTLSAVFVRGVSVRERSERAARPNPGDRPAAGA